MEVGPSAAPMIPRDAASFKSKPRKQATTIAAKIPNCAAAPKRNSFGLDSSGQKSIIAPIPINRSRGIASEASIPTLKSHSIIPLSLIHI